MQSQPEQQSIEPTEVTVANDATDIDRVHTAIDADYQFDKPISRHIWVTFQKEGIHRYPQAATEPGLWDVRFLAFPHRHIFHFRVEIEVEHNDRDIEFIQFKRWCEALYNEGTLELENQSCEMLAENLMKVINSRYPGRELTVSVAEDNENGATLRLQ